MIGRLRGELVEIEGNLVIVDCGGVGYEVSVPEAVLMQLPAPGEGVTLLTRQIVREDAVTLYGFLQPFSRRLFDLLLTVQGCGPKVALALLGQVGDETVAGAVLAQDARVLTRATGVGPKLAERIILELKAKMQEEALARRLEAALTPKKKQQPALPTDELVDALLALGYRRNEAENAAAEARDRSDDVQEQLRHALRMLQK
ncbi:MAG: Holliday junction branch migration protein RuvA [Fimbriimonas sp.]